MNVTIVDQTMFLAFWLSFSRWSAVLIQLPLFDNVVVPNIVKVLASFVISYAFFPDLSGTLVAEIKTVGIDNIWVLTMFHTCTGLIIGFLVKSIMSLFIASEVSSLSRSDSIVSAISTPLRASRSVPLNDS